MAVHSASLEVLEKSGVMVENQEALRILSKAGCEIESNVVKIQESLVDEAFEMAPSSFEIYTRDGKNQYTVGGDNVIFNPGSAAIFFIDRETAKIRRAKAKDFQELVRLTDALEHIHAQSTSLVPSDVPEDISDLYRLYIVLKNSKKPVITGAFTKEGLIDMKRMLEAVVGGPEELADKPRAIFDCCPSSPLMWSDVTCQNLIDCAKNSIPAEIIPAPQMGATSPVTISGALVEANAEFLCGLVISQLVKPSSPVIFGGSPSVFDMRYSIARLGAIETVMAACASTQIGKHYGVPTHGYLGLSDSKTVDSQSSFESGMGIILAAASKVNIVSGPGMLASENCQSLEKLVIDNELCGTAYRLIEDITVDEIALATDLIIKIGPGGHFLSEKHTRENFLKEQFMPSAIFDRLSPEAWAKAGSKNTAQRSKERVNKILEEHSSIQLSKIKSEKLETEFKKILKKRSITLSQLPIL
jgi:trimethylamine--corrinoid protein Co-methyltransferase